MLPVQSAARSAAIKQMLMGLTGLSPRKAPNVASIGWCTEDVLCGTVIHSAQRLKIQQCLAWFSTLQSFFSISLTSMPHIWTLKTWWFHRDVSQVHQHLQTLPKMSRADSNIHVYSCWIFKSNIISCLVDRHFDGYAHKGTLMLSLVMLLWWPKDGSLSPRIQ